MTTPISLSVSSTPGPTIAAPHWVAKSGDAALLRSDSQASLALEARLVATTPPQTTAAASISFGSRSNRSSR